MIEEGERVMFPSGRTGVVNVIENNMCYVELDETGEEIREMRWNLKEPDPDNLVW